MTIIELFGLPGSGKTYFYKSFAKTYKFELIDEEKLIKKIYKDYFFSFKIVDKIFINHHTLIPNLLLTILLKLIKNKILNFSNYNKVFFQKFEKLQDLSNFSRKRTTRIKYLFLRNLILEYYLINQKKKIIYIKDQSFAQFPYLKYEIKNLKKRYFKSIINQYYGKLNKNRILVHINTKIDDCIKRSNSRIYGKFYLNNENIKKFKIVNKICLDSINNNKFDIIKLNDKDGVRKNIIKLKKYIQKKC